MFPGKGGGKSPGVQINSTVYIFCSLVLVSVLLLMLSSSNTIINVKNTGMSIFLGARNGVFEISSFFSRTVLSISELSDLRREHSELLRQLERYDELERSNAEIIQENLRLREQLGFSKTLRYKRIPAQVSGRDPDNLFSALLINKGSTAGVKNNMVVIALQDGTQAIVGKVIQTAMYESLVMPIFDANSQVASRFFVKRFEGIIEGQGASENPLLMRFIPKRARNEINIGDVVVTSGMGGIFPPGINIGRVSAVNVIEYETTMETEIIPMIDFSRLEYVFVIETEEIEVLPNPEKTEEENLIPSLQEFSYD
ncbi:MAG: rod shape-determining protein MreC [Treponema sp.]|jgi:rod shape-determining protein MreC|nr:rod shape-determining protein MreC [Treponema sp.]